MASPCFTDVTFVVRPAVVVVAVSLCLHFSSSPLQRDAFDKRRAELHLHVCDSKYGKAKESFRLDFKTFLSFRSVCPPKTVTSSLLSTASPLDVLHFLHFRDKGGCTQVHALSCVHLASRDFMIAAVLVVLPRVRSTVMLACWGPSLMTRGVSSI